MCYIYYYCAAFLGFLSYVFFNLWYKEPITTIIFGPSISALGMYFLVLGIKEQLKRKIK
jgi:hypothetical protein